MSDAQKFDAARVADLARQIDATEKECADLQEKARVAHSFASSGECRLANLRSEFTRAVSSQLDLSIVPVRQRGTAA